MTTKYSKNSGAYHGLSACPVCHKLCRITDKKCSRCGSQLQLRIKNSTQIAIALIITATLCYIPANIFPIMKTTVLGNESGSTIIGGVIIFLHHGSYFIAAVIFIASIVIPMAKILSLLWICYSIVAAKKLNYYDLTRLYRLTELVGKWSMIDVYVVAILVALVQLGGLASIQPGIAANAFACMVIFTMIAANKLDTRLIWDKLEYK
ncbi:MAG: paraquat-inducible protein A [Pseudomonadota bacterium]